jgi:hypothetical protein
MRASAFPPSSGLKGFITKPISAISQRPSVTLMPHLAKRRARGLLGGASRRGIKRTNTA